MDGRDPWEATLGEVWAELRRRASGRPRPELIVAWVRAMLGEDHAVDADATVDSIEAAHAFRCEEDYVCWCVELGVRRGDLRRVGPVADPRRTARRRPALASWGASHLDPLARLALEAAYDEAIALARLDDHRGSDEPAG